MDIDTTGMGFERQIKDLEERQVKDLEERQVAGFKAVMKRIEPLEKVRKRLSEHIERISETRDPEVSVSIDTTSKMLPSYHLRVMVTQPGQTEAIAKMTGEALVGLDELLIEMKQRMPELGEPL